MTPLTYALMASILLNIYFSFKVMKLSIRLSDEEQASDFEDTDKFQEELKKDLLTKNR